MYAVAIRFFRQLIVLQEEFYIRHLAEKQILGPVLDVLLRTMPRDNLLSSACLELFALISKENIRDLIKHLVENYREKIMALAYIDTFREIITRYDHSQGYTTTVDPYFLESEDELVSRRPTNSGARGMMEHLAVDPTEEEYWNTSDDEENVVRAAPEGGATTNGSTAKPLVEYTSDEEAEEGSDAVMTSATALPSDEASKENKEPTTPGTTSGTATPPERVSEKRRREEDEDDALDKLVHHKRRNSAASSNSSISSATALRKKKNFGGGRDASPNGHGPKKIAITISSSIKNAAVKAGSEEEGK
jgi:protein phosphatase-4 regulatory subunit 3